MNAQERFLEIADFLRRYQTIWQNEIMLLYPDPLRDYPAEWLEDLARFKDKDDLIRLEKKEFLDYVTVPALRELFRRREELIQVPVAPERPKLPEDRFTFLYMIPKKQYEIRRLAPEIDHYYRTQNVEGLIDIGGGIGLLAQTLSNHYGHKVTSIDLDAQMQKTGKERNKKNQKPGRELVEYVNAKVHGDSEEFLALLSPERMLVGLHTCGALGVDLLRAGSAKKVKAMVNLPCCYHKLEHHPGSQNISRFAQENSPLHFSQFALTLASRAHKKISEKDLLFKQKVKLYRYAIHFLLHDEYGKKDFTSLGNSNRNLYDGPFSEYALEQFKRADISPRHSADELNRYYQDKDRQDLIWKMQAAGLLRDSFGRLLELYLLLDRLIYLQEQGYRVTLQSCFDEEISSRDLGIFATL